MEELLCRDVCALFALAFGAYALLFASIDMGPAIFFIGAGAMFARWAVIWKRRADSIFARALAVALAEGEMPEMRAAA